MKRPSQLFNESTLGCNRIFKTTRYERRTLTADVSTFRKIGKVIKCPAIIIKAIPATSPVETLLAECVHGTRFDALTAFLTGLEQIGFLGIDQWMVPQFSLSHETSQTTRAPDGCNQQVIDPKPT